MTYSSFFLQLHDDGLEPSEINGWDAARCLGPNLLGRPFSHRRSGSLLLGFHGAQMGLRQALPTGALAVITSYSHKSYILSMYRYTLYMILHIGEKNERQNVSNLVRFLR